MTHKEQVWNVIKTLKYFTLEQATAAISYHNSEVIQTAIEELVKDGALQITKNGKYKVVKK